MNRKESSIKYGTIFEKNVSNILMEFSRNFKENLKPIMAHRAAKNLFVTLQILWKMIHTMRSHCTTGYSTCSITFVKT